MRLVAVLSLLLCLAACNSDPAPQESTQGDASPLFLDFTKKPEAKAGEPIDPATCPHVWVPAETHPYQTIVNGMPMTRMCFVQRCNRCGKVRHECARARAQLKRARERRR